MVFYVFSYMFIYVLFSFGGIIISVVGFFYFGFGIIVLIFEWGWFIVNGQQYVVSFLWYILLFFGFFIMFVVIGLNVFGDGICDVIDLQVDIGDEVVVIGGGV